MPNSKDIQRRIKSVDSIKKITRAMEMVAASKMRKAIESVLKTRTYANLSWETIVRLSNGKENLPHPLLQKKEKIEKVGLVLITSNRGLCGGFNTSLINKILSSLEKNKNFQHEFILLGKKGRIIHKLGKTVSAEFPKADLAESFSEIEAPAKMLIDDFLNGNYDKIMLAYTDFISPTKQLPRIKQLLPVELETPDQYLGVVGSNPKLETKKEYIEKKQKEHSPSPEYGYDYLFEPNSREVLDKLAPQLIKIQIFQALLETNASEHSSRMTAMHQASESAGDIMNELQLSFNKTRQASITAEIAEISAGANALAN